MLWHAARSSNLQNMTIYDLEEAKEDKDYDAMCVRSLQYKTSLLYGGKIAVWKGPFQTAAILC